MGLSSTGSAPSRSALGRAARGLTILPLGLVCFMAVAAQPPLAAVRISEIAADASAGEGAPAIELLNDGASPLSLNGAVVVAGGQVVPLSGLADVAPGGTVVIRWNQTGASGGSQYFTGSVTPLDPARGSVALFRSDRIDAAGAMLAYVQWGAPDPPRAALAEEAGLWEPAALLPPAGPGQSLALLPGSDGRSVSGWSTAAPTVGAPNAFPAPGLRGWSRVGPPSTEAPALAASSAGLELISAAPGGGLRHDRLVGDVWTPIADLRGPSRTGPSLAAAGDGTLNLVSAGLDGRVQHNRFQDGQWRGFVPTGGRSALPAALAINGSAGTTELVIAGLDGQLRHGRFDGAAWSGLMPVGAASSAAPSLLFNSSAGLLELLFSGPDGAVLHARFDGSAWSAPVSTGGRSRLRPALAAPPDGALDAAISAADGSVCVNRFQDGAWQGWQPVAGAASEMAPTLVYNPASHSSELFFVGTDHVVRQARRTGAGWGPAASTGAASRFSVAAAAGPGGTIDLVITGQDGNLWHNRFQAGADELRVSFARDVQPIFDARCGCHVRGQTAAGLDLAAGSAYDDLVGAPSFQADMSQVEPGAPEKSYLLRKVDGTQLDAGGAGGRMPLGRAPLSPDELSTLRRWIDQGAPNN